MHVSRRRRTVATNGLLGVAVLAVGATAFWSLHGGSTAKAAAKPSTTAVRRGTVLAEVSTSGSVSSARQSAADFGTAGTVTHIYVKVGAHVDSGDTIATVDDTTQRANVVAQQANVSAAGDNVTSAQHNKRTSSAQLATAEAQLTTARSQLSQAETALQGTTLTAPISGTVTAVNGTVGSSSTGSSSGSSGSSGTGSGGSSSGSGGGSSGSGTGSSSTSSSSSSSSSGGFIDIVDMGHLQVTADVDEADTLQLKRGQSATVTLNAMPDGTIPAKLIAIDPNPITQNNVVQYQATIALKSRPKGIRIGQTATVDIVTAKADDALYVPSAAVHTAGGRTTVTVLSGGKQVSKVVKVGVQGSNETAITSGLTAGQQVVLSTGSASGGGFPSGGFPGRARFGGGGGGLGGGAGGGR